MAGRGGRAGRAVGKSSGTGTPRGGASTPSTPGAGRGQSLTSGAQAGSSSAASTRGSATAPRSGGTARGSSRGAASGRGLTAGASGSATRGASAAGRGTQGTIDPNLDPELFNDPVDDTSAQDDSTHVGDISAATIGSTSSHQSGGGEIDGDNFIINADSRAALRKAMASGTHLPRKHKVKAYGTGKYQPWDAALKARHERFIDRVLRWNLFLVHSNFNFHDQIVYVVGPDVDIDGPDYDSLRTKILENSRTHKSVTMGRVKHFMAEWIADDESIREISEATFKTKCQEHFNDENFFYCFQYMKNFVNIEGSTDLGTYFMKSIFVNLCAAVRRYVIANETADAWQQALTFFDEVALLPNFDEVDISQFQQLSKRFREVKDKRKRDIAATQAAFIDLGPPPKKTVIEQPISDTRKGNTDIDDNNDEEDDMDPDRNDDQLDEGDQPVDQYFGADGTFEFGPVATPSPARFHGFGMGGSVRSFVERSRLSPLDAAFYSSQDTDQSGDVTGTADME